MLEAAPSLLCLGVVAVLVILCLADRNLNKWSIPLAWFITSIGWMSSFVGFWLSPDEYRPSFAALIGILVPLTGPPILLLGLTAAAGYVPKGAILFAYATALIVLAAPVLSRHTSVTDPLFGRLQFPFLLLMNASCLTILCRTAIQHPRTNFRRLSFLLAVYLGVSFTIGGTSFYLSYFHFGNPRIHPWFGDLAIASGMVATYHIWDKHFIPEHPKWKRVFVVYGRNQAIYTEFCNLLRSFDLEPLDLSVASGACGASSFLSDIVRYGMNQAQAIVVLFTADEFAALRPPLRASIETGVDILRWQARPNVIFEAGLAFGLDPARTILVTVGSDVSLFSDVHGVHFIRLDNSPLQKMLLRKKLAVAGCTLPAIPDPLSIPGDFQPRSCEPSAMPTDPFLLKAAISSSPDVEHKHEEPMLDASQKSAQD